MLHSPPTRTTLDTMSASTLRTIDDVLSVVEDTLPRNASLEESRRCIQNIAKRDPNLMRDSINEIENLRSILSPVTQNPHVLVNLMAKTGAMLAGPQATSFFYPICDMTDAPWDFFCYSSTSEEFICGYKNSSTVEVVEDVHTEDGVRVVHMRKSIPGFSQPANVRIFVSNIRPLESVLGLKNSYEQTIICAAGAICFWPKLISQGAYRVFDLNPGTSLYPKGKTFYELRLSTMRKTRLRKPMKKINVYTGIESRVESVMFRNTCDVDQEEYTLIADILQHLVYAVSDSSTRYLGNTARMI